jgi:hypothetical protein
MPARLEIAIRWLRSTVVIVSSWMHEAFRIAASASSAPARRGRAAYPCVVTASRRSAGIETGFIPTERWHAPGARWIVLR